MLAGLPTTLRHDAALVEKAAVSHHAHHKRFHSTTQSRRHVHGSIRASNVSRPPRHMSDAAKRYFQAVMRSKAAMVNRTKQQMLALAENFTKHGSENKTSPNKTKIVRSKETGVVKKAALDSTVACYSATETTTVRARAAETRVTRSRITTAWRVCAVRRHRIPNQLTRTGRPRVTPSRPMTDAWPMGTSSASSLSAQKALRPRACVQVARTRIVAQAERTVVILTSWNGAPISRRAGAVPRHSLAASPRANPSLASRSGQRFVPDETRADYYYYGVDLNSPTLPAGYAGVRAGYQPGAMLSITWKGCPAGSVITGFCASGGDPSPFIPDPAYGGPACQAHATHTVVPSPPDAGGFIETVICTYVDPTYHTVAAPSFSADAVAQGWLYDATATGFYMAGSFSGFSYPASQMTGTGQGYSNNLFNDGVVPGL